MIKRLTPLNKCIFYPYLPDWWRAFKLCPYDKLKVVILGQDPYHNAGAACGLAFINHPEYKKKSPSLRNIEEEMKTDLGKVRTLSIEHCKQGVLLLNTALTVEEGKPGSHLEIWKPFTLELIKYLNKNKDNLVWVLWGSSALAYREFITNPTHQFVISSHPSPFSCYKPLKDYPSFIGSKPFSKINSLLKENKKQIIW